MIKVKVRFAASLSLLALFLSLTAAIAVAQSSAPKSLQGKVIGANDAPLSGAIVYLQDGKTNSIRSFISTSDGSYRFGQLASDTDYQVWAQYKSDKSSTKTVSSYDSRKTVVIDLQVKTK